jgi:periplasmic protein TonB
VADFSTGDEVMIATARMSPIASLSLPRIGAWSASLSIHLAIIALLLSAPAAIRLVQLVKADQQTFVHFIDPKPIEVQPVPLLPAPVHHAAAPTVHHVAPVIAVQPENTSASQARENALPVSPAIESGTESSAPQDVAPSAIAYGSKTSVPYPTEALRRHEQGTVILRVLVDAEGKVLTVEIETSSGSPRLDRAARDAVKSWSFNPAKHGGVALSAWARVPVSFNLSTL